MEPTSNRPVGFVSRRLARPCWGFCWPKRLALYVHEVEDEPLLFTVRRSQMWGRRWLIYDADECQVGSITGQKIVAVSGGTVATMHAGPAANSILFQARQGQELAILRQTEAHAELAYVDALKDEPIVKMLVLAAVLTRMKDEN